MDYQRLAKFVSMDSSFSPPAVEPFCDANRGFPSGCERFSKTQRKNPTYFAQQSLFLKAEDKYHSGAIVEAPSFDAELHIETTTIMFADVVESVRLIEQNETVNVLRIRSLFKHLAQDVVPKHRGMVLERRGDGLLVKFPDARSAADCALELHADTATASRTHGADEVIALRIGIHSANVIADDIAIYGQGINLTARVASLAGPGETVASGTSRDLLTDGFDAEVEDLGDCYVKHFPEPIRVFRLGRAGHASIVPEGAAARRESLPTIAVMPFSISGDESVRSAAELLGETLSHYLARAGTLTVISWLSCRLFAGRELQPNVLGKILGADWLISGSCFVSGSTVLVNLQLVRCETGAVEHTDRVRNELDDLLQTESTLASALAQSIVQFVTQSEATRVAQHALPSLSSHSLLLGAVGLMHRSGPVDFHRSREALEHLLDRQPRMHSARPWLAKWYVLRTTRGMTPATADEARRALDQTSRALDSRDDDAFALAIQGFVLFHMLKDAGGARERLKRAVQINPNEPLASVFNAALVSAAGDFEAAWALAERALILSPFDPLRPYMRMIAAACALSSERFEAAAELAKQSLKENAMHAAAWRTLVIALVQCDRIAEARQACERLMRLEPTLSLKSYEARLMLPEVAKARALNSLKIAGVPAL